MPRECPYYEADGQRWPLRVDPDTAGEIRDQLGIDLLDLDSPPQNNPFVRLSADMHLLRDVLWHLCRPLAEQRGIDRKQWTAATWQEIDAAAEVLLAAVVASFPEKKRAGLTKLMAAQDAALERVVEKLEPRMAEMIDAALDDIVDAASTRTASPTH